MPQTRSLTISGLHTVVHPPADLTKPAPLIILWHGFGTLSSEEMLAQTLPLTEVQAWKAYLELPVFGHLMKTNSLEELMQRQLEDYVLRLLLPTIEPAVQNLEEICHPQKMTLLVYDRFASRHYESVAARER